MTILTRSNFNNPSHNPVTRIPASAFPELPPSGAVDLAAFLDRLEELLGHGVNADWFEHPNPEDGRLGELILQVHVLHFADPEESPWMFSMRGEVFVDTDLAPEWMWTWDSSGDDEVLWESAPELSGWAWPSATEAADVLALFTRELAKWDDGLSDPNGEES